MCPHTAIYACAQVSKEDVAAANAAAAAADLKTTCGACGELGHSYSKCASLEELAADPRSWEQLAPIECRSLFLSLSLLSLLSLSLSLSLSLTRKLTVE